MIELKLSLELRHACKLLQRTHRQLVTMRKASLVHDFTRARGDVALSIDLAAHVLALASLDHCIDFEGSEHFVAHAVVVEGQSKVALNLDAFDCGDEVNPLDYGTALQAQEPEDCGISLSLASQFS